MRDTVLNAVSEHPNMMSALLLEHLLLGIPFGRMNAKGLMTSSHYGIVDEARKVELENVITDLLSEGEIVIDRISCYPCLRLKGAASIDYHTV